MAVCLSHVQAAKTLSRRQRHISLRLLSHPKITRDILPRAQAAYNQREKPMAINFNFYRKSAEESSSFTSSS